MANELIASKYTKDRKVGEGTYAVVYLGPSILLLPSPHLSQRFCREGNSYWTQDCY